MSEYTNETSLVQMFNCDKERLLKALDGQLICNETENGFEYENASEEECRAFIINIFDKAVYHALQGYQSGRVLEKTAEANGINIKSGQFFKDYLHFMQLDKVNNEFSEEYNYGDPDNPDDFDE